MDPRFLEYYERELKHVRELGGEFARDFPKVAGRLGLDAFQCADPYVERLIEAFAFLTARVQLKLGSAQGDFTQQLLALLHPGYLAPTPSMAVVQLEPTPREGSLVRGVEVARGAALRTALGAQQTACEYRTAHPVTLWPLELESADYRTNLAELIDLERVALPSAKAGLRVVLRATRDARFDELPLQSLPLFLRGGGEIAARLYEQLLGANVGMVTQSPTRPLAFMHVERGPCVSALGFEDDEALLPTGVQTFSGYRLLQEFFAFPERFMFANLERLAPGLRVSEGSRIELVLLFDRADARLDGAVKAAHFALFCTPAINLFPRSSDRIQLSEHDHEYHVVPDRARPLDFEVHTITSVRGHASDGSELLEFLPLYAPRWRRDHTDDARYTVRREARLGPQGRQQRAPGAASTYVPSELFLALSDGAHGTPRPAMRQLAVSTLCTNRMLPLLLSMGASHPDFTEQSGAPVSAVRCVAGPTPPRSSPVHGELAWGLLSHLSVDYLALTRREGGDAGALKTLLSLYARFGDASSRAQIEGIHEVRTQGVVRPLPFPGPMMFGRGTEVTITCDETSFQGTGAFLLGAVLQHFFAKYASINAFTETVLRTKQRGEVMRWPTTPGRRETL